MTTKLTDKQDAALVFAAHHGKIWREDRGET